MTLEEKVDKLVTDVAEIKTALKYDGTGLIPSLIITVKKLKSSALITTGSNAYVLAFSSLFSEARFSGQELTA
jgi:hypothetical protein